MSEFLELVKTRRSVRTFDGTEPEASVIEKLAEFAQDINNPFGGNIRFKFLNADDHNLSSPVLAGEKFYVSAMAKKGEQAELAYGYAFEALLMQAHKMGLGTVWIGGTMPREKFEKASGLTDSEFMACVSPLGTVAKKMSVKEALMRKGVKADNRLSFDELFFAEDFKTPLKEGRTMELGLHDALEAVRLAPSAVNKQPWRVVIIKNAAHFYENHDKGYLTPDYDLQKIDLGIGLYHFEQELLEEGRTPVVIIDEPEIDKPENVEYVATIKW